jgi:hypothetical protein
MQEQKGKPEIQKTIAFLRRLKLEIQAEQIRFDNYQQILILREKLLYWYRKQKPAVKEGGNFETSVEFASRIDQEEGILIDSIKMLWHKDETTGEYKYPSQRDKFLNRNS